MEFFINNETCISMERVYNVVKNKYELYNYVEMKKEHPCGENLWQIIRMGMDIRIKCQGCDHSVLMPRREFERKMKRVVEKDNES